MTDEPRHSRRMKREDAVALAIRMAGEGRLDGAGELSAQLIAQFPGDPDTIAMRAYVLHAMRRHEDAVALLERAVAENPDLPVFHSNLCEMHRQRGRLDEALRHGLKAVQGAPSYADAWNNLGIVRFERNELAEAEDCYRRALALRPDFAEAHNNLGNLLRRRARSAESLACYEAAIRLRPDYADALTNAGKAYLSQRRFEAADEAFRRAAALRPEDVDALSGVAAAAHGLGKGAYAMTLVSRLTGLYPDSLEPLLMMAQMLVEDHKLQGAQAAAREALALDPGNERALACMGRIRRELGHVEDSVDWFRMAQAANRESPDYVDQEGVSLLELGRIEEACAAFERAIAMAPDALRGYAHLANARKVTADDPYFARFREAARDVDALPEHERIAVHYALGKALDDAGEPLAAIDAYMKGARLKRAETGYAKQSVLAFFDRVREIFSAEAIAAKRRAVAGSPTEAPIFIVGMPRSGSTLTEQILSGHSQVFGAGEVRTLHESVAAAAARDFGDAFRFPELFRFLGQSQAEAIADGYLRGIPNWDGARARVTDKMLANFFHVGLIHVVMPGARIVHIRRNPVDTCLSCFTRLFREDLPYSYDFDDLADYYGKYAELMAHWRRVLPPGSFHEVRYEDLVNDTETTARALLDYAGLPWEAACLASHENRRVVKTASVTQVREPIHTRSVERWRRYGPAVQPLADRLAGLMD